MNFFGLDRRPVRRIWVSETETRDMRLNPGDAALGDGRLAGFGPKPDLVLPDGTPVHIDDRVEGMGYAICGGLDAWLPDGAK